jgi:hypothetical protein
MSKHADGYYWSARDRTIYRVLEGRWFQKDQTSVFPDRDDLHDPLFIEFALSCELPSPPAGELVGPLPVED